MSIRGYAIDWYGRCPYCGCTLTTNDELKPTHRGKDHIVPQRNGGQIHHNLVYTCADCNNEKNHLTLFEWRLVRLARRQSPFFAWDVDIPGQLWRWIYLNVYLFGRLVNY